MSAELTYPRRIQFAETDLAGVLHFSNYFRLMEEIEHAFWRSLGYSVIHGDGPEKVSWPRVTASCEYLAPARFEDELTLKLRITDVGARSLTFEVDFLRDGQRIARGRIKAACCATRDGAFRSIPIPDYIRGKLERAKAGETA